MTAQTQTYRECDASELLAQIGRGRVLAISGGRVVVRPTGVTLPVHAGYSVEVDLAGDDTYTVRRVFTRAGKRFIKGTQSDVYADQVGEAAYRASCYVNVAFPESDDYRTACPICPEGDLNGHCPWRD